MRTTTIVEKKLSDARVAKAPNRKLTNVERDDLLIRLAQAHGFKI